MDSSTHNTVGDKRNRQVTGESLERNLLRSFFIGKRRATSDEQAVSPPLGGHLGTQKVGTDVTIDEQELRHISAELESQEAFTSSGSVYELVDQLCSYVLSRGLDLGHAAVLGLEAVLSVHADPIRLKSLARQLLDLTRHTVQENAEPTQQSDPSPVNEVLKLLQREALVQCSLNIVSTLVWCEQLAAETVLAWRDAEGAWPTTVNGTQNLSMVHDVKIAPGQVCAGIDRAAALELLAPLLTWLDDGSETSSDSSDESWQSSGDEENAAANSDTCNAQIEPTSTEQLSIVASAAGEHVCGTEIASSIVGVSGRRVGEAIPPCSSSGANGLFRKCGSSKDAACCRGAGVMATATSEADTADPAVTGTATASTGTAAEAAAAAVATAALPTGSA
eukprot:6198855-Pleurochrysis_carterae.AAC.1